MRGQGCVSLLGVHTHPHPLCENTGRQSPSLQKPSVQQFPAPSPLRASCLTQRQCPNPSRVYSRLPRTPTGASLQPGMTWDVTAPRAPPCCPLAALKCSMSVPASRLSSLRFPLPGTPFPQVSSHLLTHFLCPRSNSSAKSFLRSILLLGKQLVFPFSA